MTAPLPAIAKTLLDADTYGTLTTIAADGSPHSTVMWIDRDGDDVLMSTVVGRLKERHLRRDPRVSVSFFDPANPYSYVTVNGTAALDEAGGRELIERLSWKYKGETYTGDDGTDNVRVVVRVTPQRVIAH